ncbi:MAG: hypothetical protein AVDCRST_MAG85-3454, partial [uncultured Solirubrobacteraceae bacterium]
SFTVANEGTRSSRATIARTFLSRGRQRGSDDIRLTGDRRIVPLRAGRQLSTRVTLGIPRSTPTGEYYLIVCVDPNNTINEIVDDHNCRFTGQRLGLNVRAGQVPGPKGPPGPPGPAGGSGASGASGAQGARGDADTVTIKRTAIDTGFGNVDDGATEPEDPRDGTDDGDEEEGSTSTVELAKVGPFTIVGMCREVLPTDLGFDNDGGGVDEAKILVFHDEAGGTMAFQSHMGRRANIPAGRGTAGNEGATGGEGKHQLIATFRDGNEGMSLRAGPNSDGGSSTPNESRAPDDNANAVSGFQAAGGYMAHSNGFEAAFTMYAGIDVLGEGVRDNEPGQQYPDLDADRDPNTADGDNIQNGVEDDKCVFGGTISIVR